MRDLLPDLARLSAGGTAVGRAVVTQVWGSAPRPAGAALIATAAGTLCGSVSGGCVENAAALAVGEAITRGTPRLERYGVSDETAWSVGLACGGSISVWVEPAVRPEIVAGAGRGGFCVATVLDGPVPGVAWIIGDDGEVRGPLAPAGSSEPAPAPGYAELDSIADAVVMAAQDALATDTSRVERLKAADWTEREVFLEVFPRQPRLVIVGAVHIATALVPLAKRLGYHVVVCDGRQAFLDPAKFPEADELLLAWPADAFARVGLDAGTYVCILSHDPKFDEPASELALRSNARYVGAIGSKKTQASRRERLRAAGITAEQLARLHGPIGLDLGGRSPAETALAILAEMTAVRYGASGGFMRPAGGGA